MSKLEQLRRRLCVTVTEAITTLAEDIAKKGTYTVEDICGLADAFRCVRRLCKPTIEEERERRLRETIRRVRRRVGLAG